MKKIIYILSLFIGIFLVMISCNEDTINLDPIGDTEAGFFQNEEQMTMAVMGIYQKVNFFYVYHGGDFLSGIWMLPGDDLTTTGNLDFENFVGLNGTNDRLEDYYQYSYQLIARANTLLQKIEENGDVAYSFNPELKDYHQGEALFLRGWKYFRLWNIFGSAAPLVTDRITDLEDAYPPSSNDTELLDQAISDLTEATNLLPTGWPENEKGRVTKNSAYGMLGKVYVFRGTVTNQISDFTKAIEAFDNISNAGLAPSYGDNFSVLHENNIESLFEFQSTDQAERTNAWLNNDEFAVVGAIATYYGYFNYLPSWEPNVFTPTESIYNAFDKQDPRVGYNFDTTRSSPRVHKYIRDGEPTPSWTTTGFDLNNTRILRYADILLLKAEAIVRTEGNLSEAVSIVNQIRERARLSSEDTTGVAATIPADLDVNESNPDTVLEWIFNERRLELAFEEGHRWNDLRRRHIAGEIDLKTLDFSSKKSDLVFEDYNVFFPIPENEIVQNPDLKQNTGY